MSDQTKYLVRQYRPNYFSGFENEVVDGVDYESITKVSWADNFKHDGFDHFSVEPYHGDELIVTAHYKDGSHWVVAFALPENSGDLLRVNWRYKQKIPNE